MTIDTSSAPLAQGSGGNDVESAGRPAIAPHFFPTAITMTGGSGDDIYYVYDSGDTIIEAPNGGYDHVYSTVSYTLGANIEALVLLGTADINATGNDQGDGLTGNTGSNVLTGGAGNDILNDGGAGGADTMIGGAGNDGYFVNNSADTIVEAPGGGTDQVVSTVSYALSANIERLTLLGSANLSATANDQGDTIVTNSGIDTITGGAGDDNYYVNNAGDTIAEAVGGGYDHVFSTVSYSLGANIEQLTLLGTANLSATANDQGDAITSNSGIDMLTGGAGDDVFNVNNSADTVVEAAGGGFDKVFSTVSYKLPANVEQLTLIGTGNIDATGNDQGDILNGNTGSNTLVGGQGNDIFNDGGPGGADVMEGGSGNDTYYVNNSGDTIVENTGGGTDQVFSTVSYVLGNSIEKLTLEGSGNLSATANNQGDIIVTNSGVDTITGGLSNDIYYINNSADKIVELPSGGIDRVYSSVDYTLGANIEQLFLLGNADINGTGNNRGDIITGNTGSNILTGGTGDDTLNDGGPGGADTMIGGAGNDSYYVNNSGDTITEAAGGGDDYVYSTVSYTLGANLERLILQGTADLTGTASNQGSYITSNSGVDTLIGGSGNDTFYIHNSADTIIEAAGGGSDTAIAFVNYTLGANVETLFLGGPNLTGIGNDQGDTFRANGANNTMIGGAGNDTYYLSNSSDTIIEAPNGGYDQIFSSLIYNIVPDNVEKLTLTDGGSATANNQGDTLVGDDLSDVLIGGTGNDILDGKGGNDTLIGGGGKNIFILSNGDPTIDDFTVGNDLIELDRSVYANIGADGTLAASAFEIGSTATNASTRILYNSATGEIFIDADGSGSQRATKIAEITPGTALTASSFQIVG